MNIHYKLKNFRTFDEKGAEIDLAPITILTGCNSSGKSSITKSLLLLGEFCKKLYKSRLENYDSRIDFSRAKIDFQQNNNLSLGTFDKVINENNSDGIISFEYRMHSHFISDDIIVKMYFSADKSENSKNGYLTSYSIFDKDHNMLFSSTEHGLHCDNLNLLLHSYHNFFRYYLLRKQLADFGELGREDAAIQKREEEKTKEIELFLKDNSETLKQDLTFCQRYLFSERNRLLNDNIDIPLQKLNSEGTLFYLNNWNWFKTLTPETISNKICSKFNTNNQSPKFNKLMCLVVNDFIESGEANFIDYYLSKEASFLKEEIPSDIKDFEVRSYYSLFLDQNFCDEKDEDDVIYLPDGTESVNTPNAEISDNNIKDMITHVSFDMIYQMATTIDYNIDEASDDYYYRIYGKSIKFEHRLFRPFNFFAKCVSDEALSPLFLNKIRYISTSRVSVERIYTYKSNEFSRLIEEYIENKRNRDYYFRHFYEYDSFINKWIKAFGIGEKVELETDEEGIGTKIKIIKANSIRLLADEGYGVTQLVSILLQIEVAIQKSRFNNIRPVLIGLNEEYRDTYCEDNIIIEEPEIHLHPKYQSLLADMFTDAYVSYNIHFIIETHSEYLIRRLQNIIGDTNSGLHPRDISINYVYSKDDPNYDINCPIKRINIRPDGRLEDSFGKGFFDEADRQVEELVNRKVERHGRFTKK